MRVKVKVYVDPDQILKVRNLSNDGESQLFLTNQVAKYSNNYIPYRTGRLKDTMVKVEPKKITYYAPYASEQFYNNKGYGIGGINNGGLRGYRWLSRMMDKDGEAIVKNVADHVGGKVK